jgi:hypothetical protein
MSPLEPAVDSSARPDVRNVEDFRINRENYPIVANPSCSLVGARQRFRKTRVARVCCDCVQLGHDAGLRGTVERGQIFCGGIAQFYSERQDLIEPDLCRQPGLALFLCLRERKSRLLLRSLSWRRTNPPSPKFPLGAGRVRPGFRR